MDRRSNNTKVVLVREHTCIYTVLFERTKFIPTDLTGPWELSRMKFIYFYCPLEVRHLLSGGILNKEME